MAVSGHLAGQALHHKPKQQSQSTTIMTTTTATTTIITHSHRALAYVGATHNKYVHLLDQQACSTCFTYTALANTCSHLHPAPTQTTTVLLAQLYCPHALYSLPRPSQHHCCPQAAPVTLTKPSGCLYKAALHTLGTAQHHHRDPPSRRQGLQPTPPA